MSSAEQQIVTDERLRAVLLWQEPTLWSADAACRQWLHALRLDFGRTGTLNGEDPVSLAAHLAQAAVLQETAAVGSLRPQLQELGAVGELLAGLIALWLELDTGERGSQTLDAVGELIARLEDPDLQARLLLRLSTFARQRGLAERAREALGEMVALTDTSTRLGVVARRAAVAQGVEVPGFDAWSVTATPEDDLLSLPWVSSLALEAAAALSGERLEHQLRGVWDSSFHIGRTKLDDLLAALAQAEWCGSLELTRTIAKLASSHMLATGEKRHSRTHWALMTWATRAAGKQLGAAVNAAEDQLDATSAALLLSDVREDGLSEWRSYVEVAAAVWDLLDDDGASELLTELVASLPDAVTPNVGSLVANLLWRVPERWASAFEAAPGAVRSAMLSPLDPIHVQAMSEALRTSAINQLQKDGEDGALLVALSIVTAAKLEREPTLSANDALELLRWREDSVASSQVARLVVAVLDGVRNTLENARNGSWSMGGGETRTLADLASYLEARREDVVDTLLDACRDEHSAAAWQFGALEGLTVLRIAGHLDQQDLARVRAVEISPGRALFGEEIRVSLLRAAQLRVLADELTDEELIWLATCARGPDAQSRVVAIAALGDIGRFDIPAVAWSIVSAMSDPSEEVTERAISAFSNAESAGPDVLSVVRARLQALYESAPRRLRRAVVATAKQRGELELGELVVAARSDRAWTVRREASETN